MRVRAVFPRAGYMIALDDVVQRQAQNILVKMPRLFGVFGAVGVVVQPEDGRRCRGGNRHGDTFFWALHEGVKGGPTRHIFILVGKVVATNSGRNPFTLGG